MLRILVERLPQYGISSAVAYGRRSETPAAVRDLLPSDVPLYPLSWNGRSARAQVSGLRSLRTVISAVRPDLIHLHSSFAGVVGAMALPKGLPSIYTPHGYSFLMQDKSLLKRRAFTAAERYVANRVSGVVGVSDEERGLARDVAGARRSFVVTNGIPELDDPVDPTPWRHQPQRPLVIALGRIAAARRPRETAAILRGVQDLAEVRWVGGGTDPELNAVVRRHGITATGWLPRDDAVAQLQRSAVYLHWSGWDGLPLSVLEAMAFNVPVVGSTIGPLREILPPDQICATPAEATDLIRRLIEDPSRYTRALAAQARIRRSYSATRMTAEWADAYAQFAQPRLHAAATR